MWEVSRVRLVFTPCSPCSHAHTHTHTPGLVTCLPYTPCPCAPCRKPVNSHSSPNTDPIFTSSCGRRAAALPPGRRLSVRFPAAAAATPSSSSSAPAGVPPLGIRPGDRFSSNNPNVSPAAPRHQPPEPRSDVTGRSGSAHPGANVS